MAEPFLSEIRIFSFLFAPKGWTKCDGALLPINQNQALFSLLGTTYGGDGRQTFALPNLQGRVPIHDGDGHVLGETGGVMATTLTLAQMPAHIHVENASSTNSDTPLVPGSLLARCIQANIYRSSPTNLTALHPATVAPVGGNQPHQNMQPYLALTFCIALQGIFPSQT